MQSYTIFFFLRAQRERELENLKKTLEAETRSCDEQLQQMKHKHNHQVEQYQEEADALKRVSTAQTKNKYREYSLVMACV